MAGAGGAADMTELGATVDAGAQAWREWWPAPGTAEDDHWARETLATVERVWQGPGRQLYGGRRGDGPMAFDDLHGWLVERALHLREGYEPPKAVLLGQQDALDAWLRSLYRALAGNVHWHTPTVQPRGFRGQGQSHADVAAAMYGTRRIEEPLDSRVEGGGTVGDLAVALYPAQEPISPEAHYLRLEELCEVIEARTGVQVVVSWNEALFLLDALTPAEGDPARGQCREWDCQNAPHSRGVCRWHYEVAQREGTLDQYPSTRPGAAARAQQPCLVEGCTAPRNNQRGLCRDHVRLAREGGTLHLYPRRKEDRACLAPECTRGQVARGLCMKHYKRARAEGALDQWPRRA